MSESYVNDVQDLWGIYQSIKAQWEAVIAEKLAWVNVLAALRAGTQPDVSSISDSGEGGSESFSVVSAQEHINQLTVAEREIGREMREARDYAIKASPGFQIQRIPIRNCGRYVW